MAIAPHYRRFSRSRVFIRFRQMNVVHVSVVARQEQVRVDVVIAHDVLQTREAYAIRLVDGIREIHL